MLFVFELLRNNVFQGFIIFHQKILEFCYSNSYYLLFKRILLYDFSVFFCKSLCIFVFMFRHLISFIGIVPLIILVSCKEELPETVQNEKETQEMMLNEIPDSLKKDFSTYLSLTLQGTFQILPNEKYNSSFIETDFDGDGIMDKIISVNRLERANLDLKNDDNPSKMLEMGQMGNYNHVLLFNGRDSLFYSPLTIPSSPYLPLKIESIRLKNDIKSEIQIDYRIRNASYRSIYSVQRNQAKLIFQWKLFDGLGTTQSEAYVIEVGVSGKTSEYKDLNIYKAELESLPNNKDANTYNPKLIRTGEIFTTFFYLDKENKYFTLPKN